MRRHEIVPGIAVDDELFGAAATGVAAHAPDADPLSWETFSDPARWWLVPDDCGEGYKAELELLMEDEQTLKINLWSLPDLRGGAVSAPHSHPWPFEAHVLLGGYTEDRYEITGSVDGDTPPVRPLLGVEHHAGGINDVPRSVYHEVTEIHEPGRTLTLMVCGQRERGAWGYLDTTTGAHRRQAPDPRFAARLRALNPHRY